MRVIIDEDFYIHITEYNHILYRKYYSDNAEGELVERAQNLGYYGSVQQCLRGLVAYQLRREEEEVSLGGYVLLLEEAVADLAFLLEKHLGDEADLNWT